MILAGDVGGTKTLLGLFRRVGGRPVEIRSGSYSSQDARTVLEPIRDFLAAGPERPVACALGVAGPVRRGRAARVHLPWAVDADRIRRALQLDRVHVLNDLEATAWGVFALPRNRLRSLTPGVRAAEGPAGLLAAGTGLGTAVGLKTGDRIVPWAAEGGHATWAPIDAEAAALRDRLAGRSGRVEIEHVVSGRGLGAIFDHAVEIGGRRLPDATRRRLAAAADRNAEISRLALEGADRTASRALDRFVRYYGAVAGDLALMLGAVGGIYVGGGIAPKILPRLAAGGFVEAFRAKGALSEFVARVPVKVVLEPRCALLGAAARALHEG
jgi:glucokinase